jgi:hypothetical protein
MPEAPVAVVEPQLGHGAGTQAWINVSSTEK